MSPSSSEEYVDYSGDDHDFGDEPDPHPDTSKLSHMTKEEMQVAASGMKLPLEDTTTTESILSTPIIAFIFYHTSVFAAIQKMFLNKKFDFFWPRTLVARPCWPTLMCLSWFTGHGAPVRSATPESRPRGADCRRPRPEP